MNRSPFVLKVCKLICKLKLHRNERFLFRSVLILYFIFIVEIFLQLQGIGALRSEPLLEAPPGFQRILSNIGVEVYQKEYPAASSDFVTVVDLRIATIRNLTGAVNGDLIGRKLLTSFWQDAIEQNTGDFQAQVLLNGTFFGNEPNTATDIAFGLKARDRLITYGYGLNEYPGQNKTLAFHSFAANAQIQPYNRATFDRFPDVIGALTADADKSAARRLGRTFVGTIDTDQDATADTVLFFSSAAATQAHAETMLKNFGATEVAMLDGGGSTGLIADGRAYINTNRTLPHAIAIYASKPADAILSSGKLGSLGSLGISNQCLDASHQDLLGSANLQLADCNRSAAQRWSFRAGSLQGVGDRCLEAGDREDTLWLRPCKDSLAQRWRFAEGGSLQGLGERCLDASASTLESVLVRLRPCNGNTTQRWQRID
jgi:Ricin-type beta-trefoil lectin domain/Phosphodiester glycosidase